MRARDRVGITGRTTVGVVCLTLAGSIAWWLSHDPDTVSGLVAALDPTVVAAVVVGTVVTARGIRRLRRLRQNASHAAVPSPAPEPISSERGPAYTVHFNHEVRTPITAILGYSEMLSASEASATERVAFLEGVRRNCQALARLADETLAFARTESGDLIPFPESIDLAKLFDEPLLIFRPEAAARRLDIALSAEGRLPTRISTDVFYARQIIGHLVRTAIHLSEAGSIRIVIRFEETTDHRSGRLEIDVHDTNTSLPQAIRTALFDPWRDSTLHYVDALAGAGLRLAIAKKLAEQLGGSVTAVPPTSAGGSYRLTLPSAVGADVPWVDGRALFDLPQRTHRIDQASPLRGRVLVVEAASELEWMLRVILTGRGVEVDVCSTSADAWDRLGTSGDDGCPWSALVVDLDDPKLDGPLLVQRLLLDRIPVPIVAVGDITSLAYASIDDVTILAKPTRVLHLYDAVRPHLQSVA